MNRLALGLIVAAGLCRNAAAQNAALHHPPVVSAVEAFHEAKKQATETLIRELDAAIKKAKTEETAEELQSLEQLKSSLEAGATLHDVLSLRERLRGSTWSMSTTYDWDRNGTPHRFTETQVHVGRGDNIRIYPYHVVGPRLIRSELGLFVFREEYKRLVRITDKWDYRPAERLDGDNPAALDANESNMVDAGRTSSQAQLDYDYAIRLARKKLAQELQTIQRDAIQQKQLPMAVSIQRFREELAAGDPVPKDHPELRNALKGMVWIRSDRLWRPSPGRFVFDLHQVDFRHPGGSETMDYLTDGKRSVRIGPIRSDSVADSRFSPITLYFNEALTRYIFIRENDDVRTGTRR